MPEREEGKNFGTSDPGAEGKNVGTSGRRGGGSVRVSSLSSLLSSFFTCFLTNKDRTRRKKGNEGILTKSQQMWYVFIAFFFPSLLSHAFRPSFSQCSCALSVEARIGPGGGGEGEFFSASVLGGRGSNRGIRVEGEELFVFFFFVPSSSCSWPIAKSERGGERGRRRRPRRDVARPGTARHRPPRPHAPRPPGPSPCSTGSPPPHARRRGRRGRTGRAAPRAATPALRAVDARILGGRRRAPVGSLARGYLVRFPIMFILFSFLL